MEGGGGGGGGGPFRWVVWGEIIVSGARRGEGMGRKRRNDSHPV